MQEKLENKVALKLQTSLIAPSNASILKLCQNKKAKRLLGCTVLESFSLQQAADKNSIKDSKTVHPKKRLALLI